jgi:hypothetical protein
MTKATDYRNQAAACRRAANLAKGRPSPYLLTLAEHYDSQAVQLEASFAGQKPHASIARNTE